MSSNRLRSIVAVLALAGVSLCASCGDGADKPLRERPELTEDSVLRMMSAMRALREKAKEMNAIRAPQGEVEPGREPHLAGVGLAGLVGEPIALPILERHGFVSVVEYESTVAYTQQALHRVLLGPDGGVGGMGKSIRLEAELRELTDLLEQMRRGGSPSDGGAPSDADDLKRRIAELKDQLATQAEAVSAMKSQFGEIPRGSIDVVSKHRDELKTLFSDE